MNIDKISINPANGQSAPRSSGSAEATSQGETDFARHLASSKNAQGGQGKTDAGRGQTSRPDGNTAPGKDTSRPEDTASRPSDDAARERLARGDGSGRGRPEIHLADRLPGRGTGSRDDGKALDPKATSKTPGEPAGRGEAAERARIARDERAADIDPIAALIQPINETGSAGLSVDELALGNGHARTAPDGQALRANWQQRMQRADTAALRDTDLSLAESSDEQGPTRLLATLDSSRRAARPVDGTPMPSVFRGLQATADASGDSGPNASTQSAMSALAASAPTAAGPATAAAAPSPTSPGTGLGAPLASDDWNNALGQQSLRMAGNGQRHAEIQLHPRDLGTLNIQVTVNDQQQAQVHFGSAHAHVRDAVEAALPQLRQALASGGLSLGQTSVGDQNSQAAFAQSDDRGGRQPAGTPGLLGGDAMGLEPVTGDASTLSLTRRPGGIDVFA